MSAFYPAVPSDMEVESYALHLKRTHLLFIPSLNFAPNADSTLRQDAMGTVVQVSLRAKGMSNQEERIYAVEQAMITRTIETLVAGHVNAVYKLPECVVIQGAIPGWILVGVKKPWKYGRGKQFFLGDVAIQPAEDKWLFRLEVAQ